MRWKKKCESSIPAGSAFGPTSLLVSTCQLDEDEHLAFLPVLGAIKIIFIFVFFSPRNEEIQVVCLLVGCLGREMSELQSKFSL